LTTRTPIAAFGLAIFALVAGAAEADTAKAAPVTPAKTVEVLDSVRIPWGFRMSEMSGLAWDEDEQLLYAVSDLGHIIHFKVEVRDNKIASVEPMFFGPLTLTVGQETFHDTEDLVAINSANGKKGDTELAVVFEDGPAAARFTAKGEPIAPIPLPAPLLDRSAYRQANQRLESIAMLPDGTFIIGPQTPLKTEKRKRHTLYATDGREWTYKAYQKKGSSTKALETLPDGSLLILEAENDQDIWSMIGLGGKDMRLRRLDLASCGGSTRCKLTDYPTSTGDPIRGRFEGIANISSDLFLMVTDETFGAELMLVRIPVIAQ
jgi:hypothetical protein